jgi:hypothetical protein
MGTFRILVFTYPHHNLFAGPIGFKLRWSSMSCETGFSVTGNWQKPVSEKPTCRDMELPLKGTLAFPIRDETYSEVTS